MRAIWIAIAVFAAAPMAFWLIMAVSGLAQGQVGFVAGLPIALFLSFFAIVCGSAIILALWLLERVRRARGEL